MPAAPKTVAKGWPEVGIRFGVVGLVVGLAAADVRADLCGPNHIERYDPLTERFDCVPAPQSFQAREQLLQEQKNRQRQQATIPTRLQREQEALLRQLKADQRQISLGRRAGERDAEQQRETDERLLDQSQKLIGDQIRRQQKPVF